MGNVIPWSQIHPSITSQEPFVAVVIIDPQRQICVSEMVPFELDALDNADIAAPALIAGAQAAAAKVASGYRARRKQSPSAPTVTLPERLKRSPGTKAPLAWADGPVEPGRENPSGLRVLKGGKS